MNQLLIESFEINGARKVLEKLQHDWAFSITPAVKRGCKPKNPALNDGQEHYDYFPLEAKYRKLAGYAMIRFLLESKENMRRWLYEECELTYHCEKDKKGNVKRIIIETK